MRARMIVSSLMCLSAIACADTDADKYRKSLKDMPSDQASELDAGPDLRPDPKDAAPDLDASPDQRAEMSGMDMEMTPAAPLCGDGVKDADEGCDDGALNSSVEPDACRLDCQPARCGDGVQDTGEQCDDGPQNSQRADSCRLDCRTAFCGDGIVDTGELCDDGNMIDDDACTNSCTTCGNGIVDPGESCDDGGSPGVADDGCSLVCQVEPLWACAASSPSLCWPRWSPDAQITKGERFGATILIEGDLAVIGMPGEDTRGQDAGAVFIYERQQGQWRYIRRALPQAGATGARFGSALSTFNGGLLIGAPEHAGPQGQAKAGAVYVLNRTAGTWANAPNPVYASAPRAGEYFGAALAGPYVGAPSREDATKPGAVYELIDQAGVISASSISPPSLPPGSLFGFSLALLTDSLVIGAPGHSVPINQIQRSVGGAIFVRRINQFPNPPTVTLVAKGSDQSGFGSELAWTGSFLAVGAPNDNSSAGSITIFDDQLANAKTIQPSNPVSSGPFNEGFGYSIAGAGSVLWVGAPNTQEVYKVQNFQGRWRLFGTPINSPEPQAGSLYGAALATDGQALWVGAPLFDLPNAPDLGAVFIQ